MTIREAIAQGRTALGIELGSTRIKAILTGEDHQPIASGSHTWENKLLDGVWTYSLEDTWAGLRDCVRNLIEDVRARYGVPLTTVGAMGVSAMMHGYLPFDARGELLTPFRTWRNTMTEEAADRLTKLFSFNIPQRWSVAHLYQAMLNREAHVPRVAFLTSLAGYVHWRLTGRKVLGVGDASGLFPLRGAGARYDEDMLRAFDGLVREGGYPWRIGDILPDILPAGADAGALTEEGARLLDPTGTLRAGIPLCPPEGDAGTGMTATNSVAARTGNVSAGTSIFAMIVLEKALSAVHTEVDMVTTPTGLPVAMVHCNNCTSDLNAWAGLIKEAAALFGAAPSADMLYGALFQKATEGDADCGGLVACNYLSGEPITRLEAGRPLFARLPDAGMTLGNFMRAQLYSALATLKLGMDILLGGERVTIDRLVGHGGFFKTKGAGQRMLAAALNAPVSVLNTAGEGGAWGMALLAAYRAEGTGQTLEDFLDTRVFAGMQGDTLEPDAGDVEGFAAYMERYASLLEAERAALAIR